MSALKPMTETAYGIAIYRDGTRQDFYRIGFVQRIAWVGFLSSIYGYGQSMKTEKITPKHWRVTDLDTGEQFEVCFESEEVVTE